MPANIEEIYDRFDADLGAFVHSRVGDPVAAEDVLQDVYLKIHSRVDTVKEDEKLGSWVFRIARNTVIDFYRAKKPAQELDELPDEPHDPENEDLERRLHKSVRDMMEGLPPDHREALYLSEYEDLTRKELADRLGVSLSGAKSRVRRARIRLKAMLLDCCHFELDRRGRVTNYYGHEFVRDENR